MDVKTFECFVSRTRRDFRLILNNFQNCENDSRFREYLKDAFDKCCSSFEEETLIENLAEEYKSYLKDLRNTLSD